MASSTSLSDFAAKSFKRDNAALRKDSDFPNLMKRIISIIVNKSGLWQIK